MIVADLAVRFTADLTRLADGMGEAEKSVKDAAAKITQLGSTMQGVGVALTAGVTAPIVGLGAAALKTAIDFERAMTGVAKTVDAPASTIAALGREFVRLSESTGLSSIELAKVGEAAGQLGVPTEHIAKFTEVMAAMGVSTNLSAEEAATTLARFANIAGTSLGDVDRLGSVIVELGNNFATTEAEIAAMGLRLAGAGSQIGLTEAQILAFAASLSAVGIEAEAGGSAMSKVFIEIAQQVATSGKKLDDFAAIAARSTTLAGVGVQGFADAFRKDAAGAIAAFIEGLGAMDSASGETLIALEELGITEVRMRDALLRSSGAADTLSAALDKGTKAWEDNNALTEEAAKFYATTGQQLAALGQKASNVAAELGASLKPAFDIAITVAGKLLDVLRFVVGVFDKFPVPLKAAIIAVAALAAAIGPLLVAVGSMLVAFAALAPFFPAIVAGFSAFAAPVAAAAAGFVGLVTVGSLLISNWSSVQSKAKDLFGEFRGAVAPIVQIADALGSRLVTAMSSLGRSIADLVLGPIAEFLAALGKLIFAVAEFAIVILDKFKVFDLIGILVKAAATLVVDIVTTMVTVIVDVFKGLGKILDITKTVTDGVTKVFQFMSDVIVGNSIVPDLIDGIRGEFASLDDVMVKAAERAAERTNQAFRNIVNPEALRSLDFNVTMNADTLYQNVIAGGAKAQVALFAMATRTELATATTEQFSANLEDNIVLASALAEEHRKMAAAEAAAAKQADLLAQVVGLKAIPGIDRNTESFTQLNNKISVLDPALIKMTTSVKDMSDKGFSFGETMKDVGSKLGFTSENLTGSLDTLKFGALDLFSQFTPMGVATKVLQKTFEALEPAINALEPIFTIMGKVLASLLVPVLRALFPIFKIVGIAATFVGEVFARVAQGITFAIGHAVRFIGILIDKLHFVSGKGIIRAGESLLESSKNFGQAAEDMQDARDDLRNLEWPEGEEAMEKVAEEQESTTAAIEENTAVAEKIVITSEEAANTLTSMLTVSQEQLTVLSQVADAVTSLGSVFASLAESLTAGLGQVVRALGTIFSQQDPIAGQEMIAAGDTLLEASQAFGEVVDQFNAAGAGDEISSMVEWPGGEEALNAILLEVQATNSALLGQQEQGENQYNAVLETNVLLTSILQVSQQQLEAILAIEVEPQVVVNVPSSGGESTTFDTADHDHELGVRYDFSERMSGRTDL